MPNESEQPQAPAEETNPLEEIRESLKNMAGRMDDYERRSARVQEPDSDVSDLADLFDGLGKKLDAILGHVKPKETVVSTSPQPSNPSTPASPSAASVPKRKAGAGFWW